MGAMRKTIVMLTILVSVGSLYVKEITKGGPQKWES